MAALPIALLEEVKINMAIYNMPGADSVPNTREPSNNERFMLTIKQAASYFNIGEKKMRRIAEDRLGDVAIYSGNRYLIIRPKFEELVLNSSEI